MARKPETISVTKIHQHEAGCADCGADGAFEQEYILPNWWATVLLGHLAKAHGATPFLRKERGAKTEIVVKAHTAATLVQIEKDYFRLIAQLSGEIENTVKSFCERLPTMITTPNAPTR